VLACGLCGSDVEKIGSAPAGTVLGHEVVVRTAAGRQALIHHRPCGTCGRCRAGHESTCAHFAEATIVPGGFADRVRETEGVSVPDAVDDAHATMIEPLACVVRGAEQLPRGRVLVVGNGFVGRLFTAVLERGSRSATQDTMRVAASLLTELDLPEPVVLPLERFAEGLDLFRSRDALKVVFVP
jgi:L-iditol 2-dehydrogenase